MCKIDLVELQSAQWSKPAVYGGYCVCLQDATDEKLAEVNRASVTMMRDVRDAHEGALPIVISGCIGPRGDGYVVSEEMAPTDAHAYHKAQIDAFTEARADMVTALTANSSNPRRDASAISTKARLFGGRRADPFRNRGQ